MHGRSAGPYKRSIGVSYLCGRSRMRPYDKSQNHTARACCMRLRYRGSNFLIEERFTHVTFENKTVRVTTNWRRYSLKFSFMYEFWSLDGGYERCSSFRSGRPKCYGAASHGEQVGVPASPIGAPTTHIWPAHSGSWVTRLP